MTDLIDLDAAIAALSERQSNYREETSTWAQIALDILILRALPAIDPADRIKELVKELNVGNELGKALEEDAGQLRDKLTKAVETMNIVDQSIMENTNETEWRLWGEGAVSNIRTMLAELEGK